MNIDPDLRCSRCDEDLVSKDGLVPDAMALKRRMCVACFSSVRAMTRSEFDVAFGLKAPPTMLGGE